MAQPHRTERQSGWMPFVNGDPITRAVKHHPGLSDPVATVLILLILNLPILIAVTLKGLLTNTADRVGLLSDFGWWTYQFLLIPATLLFFLWIPDGIHRIIKELERHKVLVVEDPTRLARFVRDFDRQYSHWAWSAVSLLLSAAFQLIVAVPVHRTFVNWETSSPWIFWYTIGFFVIFSHIVILAIIRVIIVIRWFNRLFQQFRIELRVLHPDGAGGLSSLGSLSVKIGYLIGIYGLGAVATSLSESYITTMELTGPQLNPIITFVLVVYVILAPVIFFAPLGTAHSAMRQAKNEFLLQLSDQFQVERGRISAALASDSDELGAIIDRMEQLQKLYRIGKQFPVWPFNTQNIIRFASSIASPLVLALLPSIIEIVAG
jgi:hypothetical protein